MARKRRSFWRAALVLIVALALTIVPLPAAVSGLRPEWVAMLLLYWSFTSPQRFGLFTAFFVGLALDLLTGTLLGQHALALITIVYLSLRFHLRIRAFALSQMAGTIVALLAIYEFILFWIDGVAGEPATVLARLVPLATSAVFLTAVLAASDYHGDDARARLQI